MATKTSGPRHSALAGDTAADRRTIGCGPAVRQQKCREEPATLGTRRSAGLEFGQTVWPRSPPKRRQTRLSLRLFACRGFSQNQERRNFFARGNKSTDASQRARSFFALHQRRKFPELGAKTWGEPMRRKLRCPPGRATGAIKPVAKQHEDSVK